MPVSKKRKKKVKNKPEVILKPKRLMFKSKENAQFPNHIIDLSSTNISEEKCHVCYGIELFIFAGLDHSVRNCKIKVDNFEHPKVFTLIYYTDFPEKSYNHETKQVTNQKNRIQLQFEVIRRDTITDKEYHQSPELNAVIDDSWHQYLVLLPMVQYIVEDEDYDYDSAFKKAIDLISDDTLFPRYSLKEKVKELEGENLTETNLRVIFPDFYKWV